MEKSANSETLASFSRTNGNSNKWKFGTEFLTLWNEMEFHLFENVLYRGVRIKHPPLSHGEVLSKFALWQDIDKIRTTLWRRALYGETESNFMAG